MFYCEYRNPAVDRYFEKYNAANRMGKIVLTSPMSIGINETPEFRIPNSTCLLRHHLQTVSPKARGIHTSSSYSLVDNHPTRHLIRACWSGFKVRLLSFSGKPNR